jgi:2-dehydro-3-deoxyphosphogluconate aldolase/(4S)-4-hydroxy-2-oxoglutarate aldolase
VYLGAFTPTEVAEAMDLGASAVKIFPAGRLGPAYLRDLLGPYPHARLLPSGGVSTDNAAEFLAAGASAVCAGTSVVPPAAVAAGEWDLITDRARAFAAALTPSRLES